MGLDIEHLTARVEAAIVAEPGLTSPQTASRTTLQKLFASKASTLGLGVVLGLAVGSAWMLKHAARATGVPTSTSNPVTLSASVGATPVAPLPLAWSAANTPSAASNPAPTTAAATPTRPRDAWVAANETALLAAARAALTQDPQRALALTQEHTRRFPQGALSQEREVIAIEALSRLGQTSAARQRARAFERQYPGSAHQQKVNQVTRGH